MTGPSLLYLSAASAKEFIPSWFCHDMAISPSPNRGKNSNYTQSIILSPNKNNPSFILIKPVKEFILHLID